MCSVPVTVTAKKCAVCSDTGSVCFEGSGKLLHL
jgi:hypothetical protein